MGSRTEYLPHCLAKNFLFSIPRSQDNILHTQLRLYEAVLEAVIWISLRSIYWAPTVRTVLDLRAKIVAGYPEDSHPGKGSKSNALRTVHVGLGSMEFSKCFRKMQNPENGLARMGVVTGKEGEGWGYSL